MPLTMGQRIKRLGMPVAAVLGVVVIGLFTMSWLLNRDALREAIEAQIRAGHPDVEGLCLAFADWNAELRLLESGQHNHGAS